MIVPLCCATTETVSHLLLHCPVVADAWNDPTTHFDITGADNVCSVVDRWLKARGDDAGTFVIGANLMCEYLEESL